MILISFVHTGITISAKDSLIFNAGNLNLVLYYLILHNKNIYIKFVEMFVNKCLISTT